jgi:hypothetical protein
MRKIGIALLVASLAMCVPAAAVAKHGQNGKLNRNAAKLCKQLRAGWDKEAFRGAYGNNANKHNAFGKCVKQTKRTLKALRKAGRESCQTTPAVASKRGENAPEHGTGNTKRKCVAEATSDDVAAVQQAQTECKTELAADPAAFDSAYGSDEADDNDEGRDDARNDDFADCVDKHAKAADAANDA